MKIQLGFDLTYASADATPMILMLNVHPSRTADLITPDRLRHHPGALDHALHRRFRQQMRAPAGAGRRAAHRRRLRGAPTAASPIAVDLGRKQHAVAESAGRCPGLPAGQPLLRDRPDDGHGLGAVRRTRRPGWRRVQAICDYVHERIKFGYQHARADPHARCEGLRRAARRLPRLRPSGRHALPLHEHPGALLHRLSRRYRRAAGSGADGFQRLVRGLLGGALVHLRCPPQHAAHRPHR